MKSDKKGKTHCEMKWVAEMICEGGALLLMLLLMLLLNQEMKI